MSLAPTSLDPLFSFPVIPDKTIHLAYAGKLYRKLLEEIPGGYKVTFLDSISALDHHLELLALNQLPDVLILEDTPDHTWQTFAATMKSNVLLEGLIIIILTDLPLERIRKQAMELKVNDVYSVPFPNENLFHRIGYLVKYKLHKPELVKLETKLNLEYKIGVGKRFFDILCSGTALLLCLPILLLIALIIKLESKGPVFYISQRVGTGYKVFNFYKFRSMRQGADRELEELKSLSNYQENGVSTFVKISKDPRVTRFGQILRKTSLDELPQLINVLKGDMSLVGNRPLPLYEAEQLTCNDWTMRFLAPAGVTGLWQINKNKDTMSSLQRKKLDNYYASNISFGLDLKIMLATLPAMWQREDA